MMFMELAIIKNQFINKKINNKYINHIRKYIYYFFKIIPLIGKYYKEIKDKYHDTFINNDTLVALCYLHSIRYKLIKLDGIIFKSWYYYKIGTSVLDIEYHNQYKIAISIFKDKEIQIHIFYVSSNISYHYTVYTQYLESDTDDKDKKDNMKIIDSILRESFSQIAKKYFLEEEV